MPKSEGYHGRILVVDDEQNICEAICKALERSGYGVATTLSALEAQERLREGDFDMVICDIRLPQMDGLELLKYTKEHYPHTLVLMITGYASIDSAVASIKLGAHDYITKPFKPEQLRTVVARAFAQRQLVDENLYLKGLHGAEVVMGQSRAMHELFALARKVAESHSSVLIVGESGTGKEVVAKVIHLHSQRRDRPFVTVNCAAIPETLLESELFGHVRGAFTGATYSRRGSFELADGGTLFLDEIGEMRPEMQAKILRALENQQIRRVGAETIVKVDARVIAATNKDVEKEVREGRFREDLFYRLNVVCVSIPPLREHREDIPVLAGHFLKLYREELKKPVVGFSEEAMTLMLGYDWPGNVRELRNVIERAVIFAEPGGVIRQGHLPPFLARGERNNHSWGNGTKELRPLREVEKGYIVEVLRRCGGNRTRAAETLGISPVTLWRKLGRVEEGDNGE